MYRLTTRFGIRSPHSLRTCPSSVAFNSELSSLISAELISFSKPPPPSLTGYRYYSSEGSDPSKRPSFFGNFISNLKSEYSKDKQIQDNLKQFREEARKLEESDALKEARRKFESIESETSKSTGVLKEQLSNIAEKVKKDLEGAKKVQELGQSVAKKAEGAKKIVGDAAETIGKSSAFKTATNTASVLKEEIEGHSLGGRVYVRPKALRKRKCESNEDVVIEANEDATGVELHKDSKFYAAFQNFKDNNPVFNKFVEARVKYEESDNPVVRGARIITDKMQDLFGGIFSKTELSEALTEIVKMDPNFCREQFLKDCERDIIPNILEAINQGDLEILEDWCFEAPFNILATPIKQAKEMGYTMDSVVLDIDNVDLTMGMMMEQGPVLAISFNAQQIMAVRDKQGNVIEGNPDQVMRIMYIFVLCRDQTELDPRAAWRLLEIHARDRQEQFL